MVIVAGHLIVAPSDRETYLAGCETVVRQARGTAGCLDFALSPDIIDERRINIFERWETRAAVEAFRGSGTGDEQSAAIRSAAVAEYDTSEERLLG